MNLYKLLNVYKSILKLSKLIILNVLLMIYNSIVNKSLHYTLYISNYVLVSHFNNTIDNYLIIVLKLLIN